MGLSATAQSPDAGAGKPSGMAENEAFRLRDMLASETPSFWLCLEALLEQLLVVNPVLKTEREPSCIRSEKGWDLDLGNAIGQSARDSRWPGHASPQWVILLVTRSRENCRAIAKLKHKRFKILRLSQDQ